MLRKVKHIGRKASKYRYVVSVNNVDIKGTKAWQPYKLVVVLSRRKKKVSSVAQSWRPSIHDPYLGTATWPGFNQKSMDLNVTLFEDQNFNGFECKNWVFVIENESKDGKRKPIATSRVDLAQYASNIPPSHLVELRLKPLTAKVYSAKLSCNISSELLSVGPATEADVLSVAGSTSSEDTVRLADLDIGNVRDLDSDNSRSSSFISETNDQSSFTQQQFQSLTNQIELLNRSVNDEERSAESCSMSRDSKRSSVKSGKSEHPSPLNQHRRNSSNDANNLDENSSQNHERSKRNSSSSDASDLSNSFQRRRLRPSVDFLPSATNEELPSQNSPAPTMQKSLLRWCQSATADHEGVKVTNFTTSWRNGLALCALLHHYKPELVNFESLGRDGKSNIKIALDGFEKAGVSNPLIQHPSSVFDKNSLISILMSIRKQFNNHVGSCDAEPDLRSPLPFVYHKQLTPSHGVHSSAKVKLLSDLEEKEIEDDVFSTTLDQALEAAHSPSKELPPNTQSNFSPLKSSNFQNPTSPLREPQETVEVPSASSSNLRLDVVPEELEEDETKLLETNLDVIEVKQTKPDSSKSNDEESTNPFLDGSEDEKSSINEDSNYQLQIPSVNSSKETDLSVSVPPSENVFASRVDNEVNDVEPFQTLYSSNQVHPKEEEEDLKSNVIVDEVSSTDDVKISSPSKEDENKDENFQSEVDKLIKSSAERNRKARALEIIAQTKAEMSSSPTSSLTDEELKRQEKVRERAQQLIKDTRASLGRGNKLNESYNLTPESIESSDEKPEVKHQQTPPDFSPISMLNPTYLSSSNPFQDDSYISESDPAQVNHNSTSSSRIFSNDSLHQSSNHCQSTSDPVRRSSSSPQNDHEKHSSISLNSDQRNLSQADDLASSRIVYRRIPSSSSKSSLTNHSTPTNQPIKNSLSGLDKNEENLPSFISGEVQSPEKRPPSSSISTFTHPLMNDQHNSLDQDSNPTFPHDNVLSHPLAVSSSPDQHDSLPSSKQERLSVICSDDVEKRWSCMVEKTSCSSAIGASNQLEAERLTLENEQRTVEERSAEVQHELQELKVSGGRDKKRREADLMQEWFQLVHKKNSILRQQDQLALQEEEQVVLGRVERIHDELIPLMTIEDSMKTFAQKEREIELLEEKVKLVNERDRLMQLMNEKEKTALDEDELLQANLGQNMTKVMQNDEKCSIM